MPASIGCGDCGSETFLEIAARLACFCPSHSFELETHLHHPHRFLNPDYSMFDCGAMAFSEAGFHASIAILR